MPPGGQVELRGVTATSSKMAREYRVDEAITNLLLTDRRPLRGVATNNREAEETSSLAETNAATRS